LDKRKKKKACSEGTGRPNSTRVEQKGEAVSTRTPFTIHAREGKVKPAWWRKGQAREKGD